MFSNLRFSPRITLIQMIISLLVVILISVIILQNSYNLFIKQYSEQALDLAKHVAAKIVVEDFQKLQTQADEETAIYQNLRLWLKETKDFSGAKYLYTMRQNNRGEYVYVVDGEDYTSEDFCHLGDKENTYSGYNEAYSGQAYVGNFVQVMDWGVLISSYYPLKSGDTVVGFVGVDYDVEQYYLEYLKLRRLTIGILASFIIIELLLGIILVKKNSKT